MYLTYVDFSKYFISWINSNDLYNSGNLNQTSYQVEQKHERQPGIVLCRQLNTTGHPALNILIAVERLKPHVTLPSLSDTLLSILLCPPKSSVSTQPLNFLSIEYFGGFPHYFRTPVIWPHWELNYWMSSAPVYSLSPFLSSSCAPVTAAALRRPPASLHCHSLISPAKFTRGSA